MTSSADPDQLASSEANWSGSTLFVKTGHVVFSKRRVKCSVGWLLSSTAFLVTNKCRVFLVSMVFWRNVKFYFNPSPAEPEYVLEKYDLLEYLFFSKPLKCSGSRVICSTEFLQLNKCIILQVFSDILMEYKIPTSYHRNVNVLEKFDATQIPVFL